MAQATLQEMAREVYLYSGSVCPIVLAQRWIRDRFRKINERTLWSYKLNRSTFGTPQNYAVGQATFTFNSTTVVGSGTAWLSSGSVSVNEQIKAFGYVFTITAITDDTHLTIDQAWLGATVTTSYIICQAYITPTPTDFHAFFSVIDPTRSWKLHLGFNSREVDRIDARRSATGVPYMLANGVYNSSQAATFELWPHPLSQNQYMYTYEKRVTDLVNPTDKAPGILRSDVLVKGALADLCRWPGLPENKNPMYDQTPGLVLWRVREAEFEAELQKCIVEDQSIMMNDLAYGRDFRYAPIDANFIQSHAFPSY